VKCCLVSMICILLVGCASRSKFDLGGVSMPFPKGWSVHISEGFSMALEERKKIKFQERDEIQAEQFSNQIGIRTVQSTKDHLQAMAELVFEMRTNDYAFVYMEQVRTESGVNGLKALWYDPQVFNENERRLNGGVWTFAYSFPSPRAGTVLISASCRGKGSPERELIFDECVLNLKL